MINIKALLTLGTKGTDKAKKEVTDVNKQLDQAADNAERMNKNLGKTPGETKQYRTQRSISGTRGAEGRNFAGLAGASGDGSFVGAYASLAANIFAVTAAFQALSNAARTEQLTQGLELMGARGGVALTLTAKNLQTVTDNAISAADAMRATAQASSAGFSGDEIERLGKVARGASLALGRDMGDSLDRLTKGAIKLEPELLDELGIMTRLDDAVKVYADTNGKAVSALTQTERRQAFLNAVLEEGERKFSDINEQIATNPYDQLSASVRNTATELGKLANNVLGPIARFFAENPFALVIPGVFLLSKALQGLGITAAAATLNIEKAFDAAYRGGEGLKTKNVPTQTVFEDVATQPGQIKSVKDLSLAFREAEAAHIAKNGALKAGDKLSLVFNKTMLFTSFAVRNAALAVRGLGVAIATAILPLLLITAAVSALTWGFAEALKAWDKFTGNTKEIKESKAKMKELAEQAKETGVQIRLMLEPGKGQAAAAFDAVANSAAAASAEIEKYYKILEQNKKAEEEGTSITALDTSLGAKSGNVLMGRGFESTAVTGEKALTVIKTQLQTRLKAEGVETNMSKLMAEQYDLALLSLSPEERAQKLREATPDIIRSTLKAQGEQVSRFKDMEESAREVNKLARGFFPKEEANSFRDLSVQFNEFSKNLAIVPNKLQEKEFMGGLAETFLLQKSGIEDSVLALESQGIAVENINYLLEEAEVLEVAIKALKDANRRGDPVEIANAEKRLEIQKAYFGEELRLNALDVEKFAFELKILGLKESQLKQSIKNVALEQKLATIIGSNAKAYIQINKNREDARLIATGGEVSFPEEATYEYALEIAKLEERTANKIAEIRKRSIDLEYELALFTINNSILDEQKKLNKLKSENENVSTIEMSLSQGYIDDLKEQKDLLGDIKTNEIAAEDATAATATSLREIAQARVDFLASAIGLERTSLQNAKKLIDYAQKLLDIQTSNNNELYKGATLSEEATAYVALVKIPALENEKAIQKNIADGFSAQLNDQKLMSMLTGPQITALKEKVSLANQEVTLIDEQINGIRNLVNSYQEGNLQKRVALDLAQKELQASKDLQASRKALSDSAINLERSKIEGTARKAGRELTPIEEDTLRTQKDKAELDNAIQERLFMNTEHDLALRNLELERDLTVALYNAQYAAIKGSLAQTVGTEAAEKELKPFKDLIDRIGPIFTESIRMLGETQANTRQAADNNLQALVNATDGVTVALSTVIGSTTSGITAPTTIIETPEAQALRLQEAVYQGFLRASQTGLQDAALGAAAPFFDAAPEGRDKALGNKERTAELHKQARAISEINMQAKLLSDVSNAIDDGFNSIFLAAEQGSKAMRDAFVQMAQDILRQIALMTIKMLAFKAIEAGLNFIAPGSGTMFMNFINPGAAGGIMPMATGGIMNRASGLEGVIKQPTYLVGEGRYNEAVVPLPNGRSIPVQMHGGGSQNNNVAVTVNMTNNGSQTQTEGPDANKMGQAIAAAVQRELVAQKAPGGLLNRYSAI